MSLHRLSALVLAGSLALALACSPTATPAPAGSEGGDGDQSEVAVVAGPEPSEPPVPAEVRNGGDIETGTVASEADQEPRPPVDPTQGEVASGDSLSRILRRAGVESSSANRAIMAMAPVMRPDTIQPGQRYEVELEEDGRLRTLTFHRSITIAVVVECDADECRASEVEADTDTVEQVISGRIESSLWAAVTEAGGKPALVALLVDAFAYDIDFVTGTRKDDSFRLVVERIELDGEFVRYGAVLAAEYSGRAGVHRAFWWQEPETSHGSFYDEDGKNLSKTLLKTPLAYTRVSSQFDPKRLHPVLHRVKGHNGTDYAAPEGTPIRAAADGKITFRGPKGGAGNMVVLNHGNGLVTIYMHMSKFAAGQKVGQRVRQKQVIGYVGMTGLATGPHLHLGVKVNGRYVDAEKFEGKRGPPIPRKHRKSFSRETRRLLGLMGANGSDPDSAIDDAESGTSID